MYIFFALFHSPQFPVGFNKFLMKEDQRKLFKSISSAQLQIIGRSVYGDINVCHGTYSKKSILTMALHLLPPLSSPIIVMEAGVSRATDKGKAQ